MEQRKTASRYLILNYIFVACLALLLLNDHYLKAQFANEITGKLSDIAGIILLPLLIAFIFPRVKVYATWISALLFVLWKSPLSQPLIEFYNEYAWLQTSRVVDYTDLYVLIFLFIPHILINNIDRSDLLKVKNIHPIFLLLPTVVALVATSPPEKHYYTRTGGNLSCYGCNITVKLSQEEIIQKLAEHRIRFDKVSSLDTLTLNRFPHLKNENVRYFHLDSLIIDRDTLRKMDFTMMTKGNRKTKIYFNGMQVSKDLADDKLAAKLRRHYKKLMFDELKQRLFH